ncbi:hypothetical protein MACH24_31430 [Erythrobacter sp. Dej080120_24]|uniref:hypothetical protein n=1 Tax=Erythrobacter sp. Dej080120_24 TaxID=3024837 RepID=UPI00292418CD|nr:hypothetical protein MACH24_31430 [Erythrobacter sp. Dej080120_24]
MFQSDLFPAGEQMPLEPLAYATGTRIAALLASGRHLTRTDISGLFAEESLLHLCMHRNRALSFPVIQAWSI